MFYNEEETIAVLKNLFIKRMELMTLSASKELNTDEYNLFITYCKEYTICIEAIRKMLHWDDEQFERFYNEIKFEKITEGLPEQFKKLAEVAQAISKQQ